MSVSRFNLDAGIVQITADNDYDCGDIIQLADGRAAQVMHDVLAGQPLAARTRGLIYVNKAAVTTFNAGEEAFFDYSADLAVESSGDADDFFLGVTIVTAPPNATEVLVELNQAAVDSYLTSDYR